MTARDLYVGIDVGTTSVKILAADATGAVVAEDSASYALATPSPGIVEQHAGEILEATTAALRRIAGRDAVRGRVAALGISTAMHGLVAAREDGTPLGPLVTWMDRRAAPIAERWRRDGTAARLYALTGAPVHPMLPSCKLAWFAERGDSPFASADRVVSMKEIIVHALCGEWVVDWSIAGATGLYALAGDNWSDDALALARTDRAKLARLVPPTTMLDVLPAAAAAIGLARETRVVVGASDGALANLGVGAVDDRDLTLTIGTSSAVRCVVPDRRLDAAGRTFCYPFDGRSFVAGGPSNAGGGIVEHLATMLYPDVPAPERVARAVAEAERAEPGAHDLVVLPFLGGERAPYWRGDVTGAIAGLDLTHSRADVMRATIEGIVANLATIASGVRALVPTIERVRLSGRLGRTPLVASLVAAAFALPVDECDVDEASAYGAALFAAVACGALPSIAAAGARVAVRRGSLASEALRARSRETGVRFARVADALIGDAAARSVTLRVLPETFAICRLSADAPLPTWAHGSGLVSITRTSGELSIACPSHRVPPGVRADRNWRALEVAGPLDFGEIGVVAAVARTISAAATSLVPIGTFDTDYVLVPGDRLDIVTQALTRAGHEML